MGKIRGIHSSPGIYTKPWFDGNRVNTKNNRKGTRTPSGNIGGGGGKGNRPWVFSDYFVIVFS